MPARGVRAVAVPDRPRAGLMLALGFLSMTGSLSTDLYLPAFPDIADDLSVSASVVQLTLTAFLVGAAFGQLMIGAISDALGRRRTLIAGLVVFALCTMLAVASPTIGVLIAVRAVQGFAGAAGTVLARAIVSDLSSPTGALRAFSLLWAMIALGPAIASPLGALLTQIGGWRWTLAGLAAIAAAMLVVAVLAVPESLPPERRHPPTPSALIGAMGRLLRDRTFVARVIAFGAAYGALMSYISSSSFIVQDVFVASPLVFSLIFSLTAVFIMSGAWGSGRFAPAFGPVRTLRVAQATAVVAALAAATLALTGTLSLPTWIVLACVFSTGAGAMMSTASAIAVRSAAATAGTASALLGFAQFTFGATASPLGGVLGTDTAVPATLAMVGFTAIGVAATTFSERARAR